MSLEEENFHYRDSIFEQINCNLCDSNEYTVMGKKSSDDRSVQSCLCKHCPLIFINPRMTKNDYDEYYRYFYRKDVAKRKNDKEEKDDENNFAVARKLGNTMAQKFNQYIMPGLTIDVGSGTGGVLYGLREKRSDLIVEGIEPSVGESKYANQKGIKTVTCLFEDYKNENNLEAANILCTQSLNHLLDPMSFLRWSHSKLEEGGRLFLTVCDFRYQCRRRGGHLTEGVQIDHPFMFVPESLRLMTGKANFKILYEDVDEFKTAEEIKEQKLTGFTIKHMRIIAEKNSTFSYKEHRLKNLLTYWKVRGQFFAPILRLHYILFYSRYSLKNLWRKIV